MTCSEADTYTSRGPYIIRNVIRSAIVYEVQISKNKKKFTSLRSWMSLSEAVDGLGAVRRTQEPGTKVRLVNVETGRVLRSFVIAAPAPIIVPQHTFGRGL